VVVNLTPLSINFEPEGGVTMSRTRTHIRLFSSRPAAESALLFPANDVCVAPASAANKSKPAAIKMLRSDGKSISPPAKRSLVEAIRKKKNVTKFGSGAAPGVAKIAKTNIEERNHFFRKAQKINLKK
jgi:hypothetical protein